MSETLLSSRNLAFELYEVLDAEGLTQRERFAEHNRETFDAALGTARSIAEKFFAPHNRKGDENEPRYEDGKAILIPEVKPAVDAFLEAGFLNAARSFEAGGMQLPTLLSQACFAHFQAANAASTSYPFLTMGAANLIESFGTDEQKQRFLQPMIDGRFFGTMALTEPHAGSSLSDIRTRAEPAADGTYRLKGNKIFISGGDHPLSENIVHMVLAKLPDAPAGVKGISLFIVPKFLVNDDGSLGPRNDVLLAGLFHKMGWRGTTSTALNFGDNGECVGYLVGKPHHGLSYMFQMMNEARIGVGMGAVMLGYAGYLYSLEYARERPQGRLPDSKDPTTAPVSIVQHADVKRMLLTQKAYVEGAFDLGLYAARLFDDTTTLATEDERKQAHELLDLLTPIVKSWPSEFCLKANELAIQILGGHGYTREYPVEQYYRDNRLNPIHEGTHGIQSLDLLGRKLAQNGGAGLKQLIRLIADTSARAQAHDALTALRQPLEKLVARLQGVTIGLLTDLAQGKVNSSLANSALYLKAFGHTVIGWRWLEQAIRAQEGLARGNAADVGFYKGKLQAARYFLTWEVPACHHELDLLEARDDTCLSMQDEWF
ncbi:acyl-CoA dehydrogenase [Pseudomonas chlororaphis]|uniref:acyl-CoA dehydrogenase n=1 Tax=Pseudomonas chlororaphis TaxID=587753 RepID=UPI0007B361BD|nr:acyl-CoA dehydrogenase [Pseudomonas chlororaphis]AZC48123.1 3-methylmercaptopropionyl-CoA dehydrogenase (DmdC) [Pseudomonas chlororaphis subsp. piscium]AZC54701.1 3-methylmercaptopropionyl-CoA dehydrogenase (DmdC) [Pseudomonas chlororaphis subsp. piscium]AZC61022.1 3-methylmercaptopropionyl-CoA dehydrogenase (DmdC) [Pseudomonas chlororaphis subsp. piscium]AZC67197.1 3-methylmercaptopropionyl-CoA dehydrogenase (DmdC) [Pseudomonas chlororaphis subsp. piscium]AZC73435.1 3-methylmercaptopropion